ncbi:hypothetical protein R1sor_006195 [Riccia sorocarpa]|uniref:Uncharacterized protein n=1 Tax=Riccia sorocarpa TaxID=122646 RepID=A0ABD3HQ20_9MARC
MVRTKQTVRKSTGGKPPDPRLGQFFKDMWKAGETSLNNVMDRGDESPIAARSEAEELEVQDMEQDADPDAHLGDEVEAASDDEDGLEPSDMQHMIVTCAFVVPRPRRIDADDVFEYLTKFEEEKRSGKRKTTTPRTGNNKKKPRPVEAQFKSIVCQTMGRRFHKEVIPLVCCSDETYAAFEKFVKRWKEGKIPDVQGTIGPSKDPRTGLVCDRDVSQLSVNRFRPINGLSDSDLKLAWTVLEEGKVWVTKPASYKEQHETWGLLARAYSISDEWLERMLKFIPEKGDKEAVLDEASSSEEESNKNKKKSKKKTVEVLPSQITTAIHRLYTAKHGIAAPSRQEPLHILHLPSICQYKLTLDEQLNCKLVFLDVTHPNLVVWGKPEFCSFVGIVRDLTVSKEFTIVSVMEYGQQLVDFTSAIKEMKDTKVVFEVGCYENERPVRKTNLAKPTWQLVYAFVSLGPEEYKPKLVDNFDYRPHSCELRYKTWKEEFTLDKGVGSEAVNIKNKAPRWDFVGIEPAEGSKPYVHPGSQRRFFCTRLLNNFSSERTTVLDFFSGGVFAREALLSSRDVIYFASSQLEAEFMAKFAKLLQTHSNRARDWFETYKKKQAGHVEVEAPPQAEQAEQSGAVTVAALTTPFVPDGSVMASAIERLGNITRVVHYAP